VTMTTMITEDNIAGICQGKKRGGIGFLADVGMGGAKEFPRGKLQQSAFFKATDEEHDAVEGVGQVHGAIITPKSLV